MDSLISSFNRNVWTWRGFHYQEEPYAQAKVVTCVKGAIFDYMIDLRPSSFMYKGIYAAKLNHENGFMLYVPKGFAHGYMTTENNTEVLYFLEGARVESAERGIRWNDPMIEGAVTIPDVISDRDLAWPDYKP